MPPARWSGDLTDRKWCDASKVGASLVTRKLVREARSKPGMPVWRRGEELPRRIKVGSVLIREHQGVVHQVLVVPDGFCWQGTTYDSLSTIAKTITGTSWNGPRFFGLRSKKMPEQEAAPAIGRGSVDRDGKSQLSTRHTTSGRSGRRSSVQATFNERGGRP